MEGFNMLDIKDFKLTKFKKGKFGGEKYKCAHLENKTKYILKPRYVGQTLNEIVAQQFLEACGFNSIPTGMMMADNLVVYGVTEYLDKLTRIDDSNLDSLTKEQKETLIKLYIINDILQNLDEGEFYIDDKGEIYSLDYGDSIISYDYVNFKIYRDDEEGKIKTFAENAVKKNYTTTELSQKIDTAIFRFKENTVDNKGYFSDSEFDAIIGEVLCAIADIDLKKFENLYKVIEAFHGDVVVSLYKLWLECLISSCKELCNNNCEAVFN